MAAAFKLCHVSVQALLTEFVAENAGSEQAIEIKRCCEAGDQVRDDLVNGLFALRFNRRDARELGTCLDGYPKTDAQAFFFRQTLKADVNFVFALQLADHLVFERHHFVDPVSGKKCRLADAKDSGDYGLLNRITQAAEDSHELLQKRIDHWELTSRSLNKYFEAKVHKIDAAQLTEDQIVERILFTVKKFQA